MNTPSPLVPQGTTPAKGKVSFFVKVLMILAVHVVVIGGMLLQGCKDTKDQTANPPPADTTAADNLPPVNPGMSNAVSSNVSSVPPAPVNPVPAPVATQPLPPAATQLPPPGPVTQPPASLPPPSVAPAMTGEAKEYVIASGDTLGAVAKQNGVSLKALLAANPGINPRKLQVGQKIQVPAGTGSASASTGAAASETAATDGSVYVVKAGDSLGRIARANHTTYKKIMALNGLKTTSIKVGEKLKLPEPKSTEPAPTAPAPAVPVGAGPVSSPTLAPAPTTAPASTGTGTGANQ